MDATDYQRELPDRTGLIADAPQPPRHQSGPAKSLTAPQHPIRPRSPPLSDELEDLYEDSSSKLARLLIERGEESLFIHIRYNHEIQDWQLRVMVEDEGTIEGLTDPNGRFSIHALSGRVGDGFNRVRSSKRCDRLT